MTVVRCLKRDISWQSGKIFHSESEGDDGSSSTSHVSNVGGGVSGGVGVEETMSSEVVDVGWHFHETKRDD